MAMPNLSAADLEKLKFFINFVSTNPTVLNLPQLQFVKDFIEKFGGKVPAGEFKMPAGSAEGKCPFGGNASGTEDATSGMNVDESEESDVDESEPESEVELDMEAATFSKRKKGKKASSWTPPSTSKENFVDTSTLFLDEPKESGKPKKIKIENEKSDNEEFECPVEAVYGTDAEYTNISQEDPIKTNIPSVYMKHEMESDFETDDVNDENYKNEGEVENDDSESSESNESDLRKPLRRITRSSRRIKRAKKCKKSRKNWEFYNELKPAKKIRRPKPVKCYAQCKKDCKKIDEEQRKNLCREFWALTNLERKNYVLSFVERAPLGKMRIIKRKNVARQFTKHYFLMTSDGDRVRVCVEFFLKTLSISGFLVKDALENNDGKGNYTGVDLRGGSGEGRRSKIEKEKQRRLKSSCNELTTDQTTTSTAELNNEKFEVTEEKAQLEDEDSSVIPEPNEFKDQQQDQKEKEMAIKIADDEENNPNTIASKQMMEHSLTVQPEQTAKPAEVSTIKKKTEKPKSVKPKRKRGVQPEHTPKPVNCATSTCRFKCHTKFTEEHRVMLCTSFWRLGYKRRKDFVLAHVNQHENTTTTAAEYRKTNRVRTFTNQYYLRSENGKKERVCQRFFNTTLCIGGHFLVNAQKNVDKNTGAYAGEDLRGRCTKKQIPDELIAGVHEHIKSYPTWVPHKNYKRRFLHSSLNIKKMYVEYKEDCERLNKPQVSDSYFRRIFHKDFKLSFLQPKSKHAHKVSSQRKSNNDSNNTSESFSSTSNVTNVDSALKNCASTSKKTKKVNPNISIYTGDEGGIWSQLTPNATDTMRYLQQRYAPQSAGPVRMTTIFQQQQQQQQQHPQQQQQHQQQQQPQQIAQLTQQAQQQLQQQLQATAPSVPAAAHSQQLQTSLLHQSTNLYQIPHVMGYIHQPHIMNAGYGGEERSQNFHML